MSTRDLLKVAARLEESERLIKKLEDLTKSARIKFQKICHHPKKYVKHWYRPCAEADSWDECLICGKSV